MIPLHAGGGVALDPSVRLAVAAVAGLGATLVMTVVMWRQSYGYVPAYVAAAALWRDPPSQVPRSAADATHLAAGMAAGVLFETLNVGYERAREPLGIGVELRVAGVTSVSEILAAAVVVCFLYGFFSWLVFPRFGGNAYETRPGTVRRQWAVSAVVYGAGLLVAVVGIYRVLPA